MEQFYEPVWPAGTGPSGPETAESTETAWKNRGHCRTMDPEVFFAQGRGNLGAIQLAKEVCNTKCKVQVECLEYALEWGIDHGVWGGKSTNQRTKIRRRRREADEAESAA